MRTSEEFGVLFAPTAGQLAFSQCLPGLISAAFTDVPATLLPSGSTTVQQAEGTLDLPIVLCFSYVVFFSPSRLAIDAGASLSFHACRIFLLCTFTTTTGRTTS